jgi:phosphonate transport system substrate-binding protein
VEGIDVRVPLLARVAISAAVLTVDCRHTPGPSSPSLLRIGMTVPVAGFGAPDRPGESNEDLRARFAPVGAYFESALDLPVDLDTSRDFNQVAAQFEAGRFDLAFLGAVGFAHALEKIGAIPLVMREEDRHVTSVFIAPGKDGRNAIRDFSGARFTFGPRLSSNHLMARHYLERQGITPESFFREVGYSVSPEQTAILVRDGGAELGAANAFVIDRMLRSGALAPDSVRIVWETPPYVNLVWAVAPALREDLRARLRDAFLSLSPSDPEHARVLSLLNTRAFLPASVDDYADLARLMRRMRMFEFDLAEQ